MVISACFAGLIWTIAGQWGNSASTTWFAFLGATAAMTLGYRTWCVRRSRPFDLSGSQADRFWSGGKDKDRSRSAAPPFDRHTRLAGAALGIGILIAITPLFLSFIVVRSVQFRDQFLWYSWTKAILCIGVAFVVAFPALLFVGMSAGAIVGRPREISTRHFEPLFWLVGGAAFGLSVSAAARLMLGSSFSPLLLAAVPPLGIAIALCTRPSSAEGPRTNNSDIE
jgi:hypothetical protein